MPTMTAKDMIRMLQEHLACIENPDVPVFIRVRSELLEIRESDFWTTTCFDENDAERECLVINI